MDDYVDLERWAEFQVHMPPSQRDRLVPMLGGYLGELFHQAARLASSTLTT